MFYLARFGAIQLLQDALTSPIQCQIDELVCLLEGWVVLAEACCNKFLTVALFVQQTAQIHFAGLI
jgi:hypothetical protein